MSTASFVRIHELAEVLRLPADRLKGMAREGTIPCLRIGRHFLFNIDAVRAALAEMAAKSRATPAGEEATHASS